MKREPNGYMAILEDARRTEMPRGYMAYERFKAQLEELDLTCWEYEYAVQELCRLLEV